MRPLSTNTKVASLASSTTTSSRSASREGGQLCLSTAYMNWPWASIVKPIAKQIVPINLKLAEKGHKTG
jgi:hypothetical protein